MTNRQLFIKAIFVFVVFTVMEIIQAAEIIVMASVAFKEPI